MKCRMERGFTLVEVLLATAIAAASLAALLTAASRCVAVTKRAQDYQKAQWVLGQGELDYPLFYTNDLKSLEVEDAEYPGEYFFSRIVEDDEDEDRLFVVRTRVAWSSGNRPRDRAARS